MDNNDLGQVLKKIEENVSSIRRDVKILKTAFLILLAIVIIFPIVITIIQFLAVTPMK